jgi:hypothetical protein
MKRDFLSDYQSGFHTHHSTSTALLKITNGLLIAPYDRLVSLLVFLDFSKAFECVNHHLLCSKLSSQFRFTTSVVSPIMSLLSDLSQCVQTNSALSVVQGSVLSPLLFSMFINDIVHQITLYLVHFYADDVQMYISCELHRIENCLRNMNMDLDRIHQWSNENCLAKNPEKSQALLVKPYIYFLRQSFHQILGRWTSNGVGAFGLVSAFDMVIRGLLLCKLRNLQNYSEGARLLVDSYLNGRTQFVRCGEKESSVGRVTCGVPQGSVFGPLLFIS